jgi:hypothetical protein
MNPSRQQDQVLVLPAWRLPGNRSAPFSRSTACFGVRSWSRQGVPSLPASVPRGTAHAHPSSSSGHSTRATLKGSSIDAELGRTTGTATSTDRRGVARRLSTETKAAYKTTEFITYVVVFAGILLASFLVKTGQDGQRIDYFRADKAWWYITLLTIGYMIARGLAKSGSREPYDDDRR